MTAVGDGARRAPDGRPAVAGSKRATASVRRVLALTIVDQGASSVSNFALALIVAHYSGARALGVFALLTTTYILGQGLVRSISSDCLLTRPETDDGEMAPYEHAGYLVAFTVAGALSLGFLAVGLALTGPPRVALVVFAAAFPLMALQDFSRFIGISRHNPGYSIRLDVAWLVLFVAAFAALRAHHLVSLPWLWGAWVCAGAAVGATTALSHLSLRRAWPLLRFWVRSERAVGVRFAGQFMLVSSWAYFIFYLLVFVISIEAVGQVKLAQLAIGPLTVVTAGVGAALISIASKRFRADRLATLRFLTVAAACTATVTAAWTALAYALPVRAVTGVFGPTWPQARHLVPAIGVGFALTGVAGIATAGLRALRAAKETLWLAVVMLPCLFVPCVGGAAVWGARGFSLGFVLAGAISAALGWSVLVRTTRRHDAESPAGSRSTDVRQEQARTAFPSHDGPNAPSRVSA